jgi:hypothetical protein
MNLELDPAYLPPSKSTQREGRHIFKQFCIVKIRSRLQNLNRRCYGLTWEILRDGATYMQGLTTMTGNIIQIEYKMNRSSRTNNSAKGLHL